MIAHILKNKHKVAGDINSMKLLVGNLNFTQDYIYHVLILIKVRACTTTELAILLTSF